MAKDITLIIMAKIKRVGTYQEKPEFPKYNTKQNPLISILQFIFGAILWLGLIFIFVFSLYTNWFIEDLKVILNKAKPGKYNIPFIVGVLCVIFIFPVTLITILIGEILKKA